MTYNEYEWQYYIDPNFMGPPSPAMITAAKAKAAEYFAANPLNPTIADFTTGYTNAATEENGVVVLAHSGDAVDITLMSPYTKIIIRHKMTERKNLTYGGYFRVKAGTEVKTDILHNDHNYTLTTDKPDINITNVQEKTVKEGEDTVFYDFNHYISLTEAWVGTFKVSVAVVTMPEPPPPPPPPQEPFPWVWVIIGIALAVFGAVVWRYFIAGKVIGGVQMPGPFIKGKLGQAAGAAPAPAAAPSSVAVAK